MRNLTKALHCTPAEHKTARTEAARADVAIHTVVRAALCYFMRLPTTDRDQILQSYQSN